MNAARKKPGTVKPRAGQPAPQQSPPPAPAVCRRCGMPVPVGDDGFCDKCEKALEQACL
jgi:hypothetical protein